MNNEIKIPRGPARALQGDGWPTHRYKTRRKRFIRLRCLAELAEKQKQEAGRAHLV